MVEFCSIYKEVLRKAGNLKTRVKITTNCNRNSESSPPVTSSDCIKVIGTIITTVRAMDLLMESYTK